MRKLLQRFRAASHWLATAAALLAAVALFVMALGVTGDVLARTLIGVGTKMAVEVSGYLLVAMVFLGLGYTYVTRSHIRVDALLPLLPPRIVRPLEFCNRVLTILYCGGIAYLTLSSALTSYRFGTTSRTSLDVIVWPIQMLIPIGLVVMLLVVLADVLAPDHTDGKPTRSVAHDA